MKKLLVLLLLSMNLPALWAQKTPAFLFKPKSPSASWLSNPSKRVQALNTCDTWTFQLQLSSAAAEKPSDAVHLPDNSYIICGNDSSATGVRGRLLKLNSQGTVMQSKAFSIGTEQLTLKRIRLFSNGKLYAMGTIADPIAATSSPVLLSIDTTNLTLLSVWRLQSSSAGPSHWKGVDLNEGRDNSFFLLSYNDSMVNVIKMEHTTNSVLWSKTYRTRNSPRPVGIGVEYWDIYVAWNETDSGYSKGVVMDLDFTTGNYRYGSRVGGKAEDLGIEIQSMTMVNLRPRITALQIQNNQYQWIRINYEPHTDPSFKDVFTVGGLIPDGGLRSQQNVWSQALAVQSGAQTNQIHIVQTYPDNYLSPIRGWQLDYAYPVSLDRLILTNDGGNLVVASSASYPQRIILTKTDSLTTLPGCSVTGRPASFQYLAPSYKADTIPAVTHTFQFTTPLVTTVNVPVVVTEDCKASYCPSPPQPDTCLRTFFKEYRNNTNAIGTIGIIDIGGGKFLLNGRAAPLPYSGTGQTQLTVIDTVGRLLASHTLGPELTFLTNIIRLRDGNLLATGLVRKNTIDPWDIFLLKLDVQLSILWQKKLVTEAPPHFDNIDAVMESSEGDIYCYLRDRITAPKETRTLLKLDASGNPVWLQQYSIGPTVFAQSNEFTPALVEMDDAVVLKYNDEDSDYSPYLMRVRKTDGTVVWVRKYQMPGPYAGSNSYSLNSLISDGGFLFMSGVTQNQVVLLKIRPDGSVAIAKRTPPTSMNLPWLGFKTGGRLLASYTMYANQGSVNGVVEMDTAFRILRTQFMQIPKSGRSTSLIPFSDSVTYSAGILLNQNPYWASVYFEKYNFNSSFASCAVSDQQLVLDNFQQITGTKQISQLSLTLPKTVSYSAFFSEAQLAYSGYYCGNNSACSSLDLQGPATICDTTNIYSFPVMRNPGCTGIVVWQMDTLPGQVKIVSVTDTLLKLKLRKSGHFKLLAKTFANCGWLQDSVVVEATAANGTLYLGRDTVLCPGNTYVLNAGASFNAYLWQDGSTDSVFTVTRPGLYYVEVIACGNKVRDSVVVTPAPPIPFSIGPDRVKCNKDTLHLAAPSGFLNYSWSNNYNISSITSQNVVVNPLVDTAYFVKAEKTPGCFAYDTIRITVNHASAIDLGADTSFCSGDSAVFNAGSGFNAYLWSNGATSQQLTVKAAGVYAVTATTREGCNSNDTVKIISVFSNPVISLDHTPTLCVGASRTLDAGNFASYLWNDGSRSRTLVIKDTGWYAVAVSDNQGCRGTDTTTITSLLPLPTRFLPADTTICSYGSLTIKPLNNYNAYLWSNGAAVSSITITQPGTYWLQVKDAGNCTGKDTLLVMPKDCMNGVYVPTAFTPDGDGKNDVFRPLLFGNVKTYSFTIYNRWGQVIFQTSDLSKSWDGKYRGQLQDTNVFVWSCTYQLEGEEPKQQKGTVTLIR